MTEPIKCDVCGLEIRKLPTGQWAHIDPNYDPFDGPHRPRPRLTVETSINDERGYPCPKDGTILELIRGAMSTDLGGWCPKCHTLWRQVGEINLADLDATDIPEGTE